MIQVQKLRMKGLGHVGKSRPHNYRTNSKLRLLSQPKFNPFRDGISSHFADSATIKLIHSGGERSDDLVIW